MSADDVALRRLKLPGKVVTCQAARLPAPLDALLLGSARTREAAALVLESERCRIQR